MLYITLQLIHLQNKFAFITNSVEVTSFNFQDQFLQYYCLARGTAFCMCVF